MNKLSKDIDHSLFLGIGKPEPLKPNFPGQ